MNRNRDEVIGVSEISTQDEGVDKMSAVFRVFRGGDEKIIQTVQKSN